ncbi:hypothetical protein ACFW04_014415 [Cataglyphis niger]
MDSIISTQTMPWLESTSNTGICIVEFCEDNNNFVIENGLLDTNRIQESMPEGRRIVDISFMWNEIHKTFNNHARGIECQFKDWKLINSCRRGLMTQLFKCQMCNYEANIWSEPKTLDINSAAVAGTVTTGIGFAQLEELCAAMNVPCMSEPTYIKYRENLVDDFQKKAMENMKLAGEAEKQLAIEKNEVINGIPYITVVADGSWMKRSHNWLPHGKILFVGIRNKFCTLCNVAERNGIEPNVHKCYKNFDRNASSTSMESDAIVRFQISIYQAILDNRPYPLVRVKKIECTNHLLRNLCKKLNAVAQSKMRRQRGFVQMRNVVQKKIRKEIIEATALRREERQPQYCQAGITKRYIEHS